MNDSTSSDAWLAFRRVYWSLAAALAALLVLLALMGFGPGGRNCATKTTAAAPTPATGSTAQLPATCGLRIG
jgi:hypothetical protein